MDDRCPRCGKGPRITNTIALKGLPLPDDYCGTCGKNWPRPDVAIVKDFKLAQSGDSE